MSNYSIGDSGGQFVQNWAQWQVRVAEIGGRAISLTCADVPLREIELLANELQININSYYSEFEKLGSDLNFQNSTSADGDSKACFPNLSEDSSEVLPKDVDVANDLIKSESPSHAPTLPGKRKKRNKNKNADPIHTKPNDVSLRSPNISTQLSGENRKQSELISSHNEKVLSWKEAVDRILQRIVHETNDFQKLLHENCKIVYQRQEIKEAELRNLYATINDVPDVLHLLQSIQTSEVTLQNNLKESQANNEICMKQVLQLQNLNRKLQEELKDYDREFEELKNQDRRVRQLQEDLVTQQLTFEEKMKTELAEQESNWRRTVADMNQAHTQELSDIMQLNKDQLTLFKDEERRQILEKKLLEYQHSAKELLFVKETELQMLTNELEELRNQLHSKSVLENRQPIQTGSEIAENESQIATLNQLVDSLSSDLKKTKEAYETTQKKWIAQINSLTDTLASTEKQLKETELKYIECRNELNSRPTPEEVLQLKKTISESFDAKEVRKGVRSSEKVAFGELQRLEVELREIRNENENLLKERDAYRSTAENQWSQIEEMRKTIISSEFALTNMASRSPASQRKAIGLPELDLVTIGQSIELFAKPSSNGASVESDDAGTSAPQDGSEVALESNSMPLLLELANAQMQRLQTQLQDIEQERDHWRVVANTESIRCSRLKEDNMNLSKRVQIFQEWQTRDARTADKVADASEIYQQDLQNIEDLSDKKSLLDIESGYDGGIGLRLNQVSQGRHRGFKGIDPFVKLRVAERLRKLKNLSQIERVIVIWGSAVLSTRITRVGVLFYFFLMHTLIIVSLHRCPLSSN